MSYSSALSSLEKRRMKDRKRNFNPQWEQDFAFINLEGKPLCLICNIALTHFKSCNLKRHYETHHKRFALEFPPWSDQRRNKLASLKTIRTNQRASGISHVPITPILGPSAFLIKSAVPDEDLVHEAGRLIASSALQVERSSPLDGEFYRQLIARLVALLDPKNTRLQGLVSSITIPVSAEQPTRPITGGGQDNPGRQSGSVREIIRVPVNGVANVSSEKKATTTTPLLITNRPLTIQRLLWTNIRRIEASTGCFICSACPLTMPSASCSDPLVFQAHWFTHHEKLPALVCVYCGWGVVRERFISHVIEHLLASSTTTTSTTPPAALCAAMKLEHHSTDDSTIPSTIVTPPSPLTGILPCPAEPECSIAFRTDRYPSLEAHWLMKHPTQSTTQTPFSCTHCSRSFVGLTLWASHMQRHARPLFHCPAPGCLVKSPSRDLLVEHVRRKHTPGTGHTPSVLLRETVEIVCNRPEMIPARPDFVNTDPAPVEGSGKSSLIIQTSSSRGGGSCMPLGIVQSGSIGQTGAMNEAFHEEPQQEDEKNEQQINNITPRFVFLLRCPYCPLNTVRWDNFLLHASICPALSAAQGAMPIGKAPSIVTSDGIYRCRVFWCSDCRAVSTERGLVAEHVTYSHDGRATVVHEKLKVRLLDSNAKSVVLENTRLAPAPAERGIRATFYSSPSDIEDDFTDESPMNLAALARPSASKLGSTPIQSIQSLSSINQPPSSMQQSAISMRLSEPAGSTSASTNMNSTSASGWNLAQSLSSATTDGEAPISLLQSAAALKTLQDLTTASGASDMANMTASEAASCVAAMAAAALSSLTGFDVNNPLTASSVAQVLTSMAPTSVATSSTTIASTRISTNNSRSSGHLNDLPNKVEKMTVDSSLSSDPVSSSSEAHQRSGDTRLTVDNGRAGDDLVSFPFDETKFRHELSSHIRPVMLDSLVTKMHQFSSYFVRILGKENHRRIPVCPECEKVFPYGLGDFKRHLLTVHLEIPREYLKDCLRFTYLPKSEEKFQEVQEQLAMRQLKPHLLEAGRRRVPLPYSIVILRRLIRHLPVSTREFLEQKMQLYSRLTVLVDSRGGFREYKCNHCSYASPHALADVRKHILGSHCGISTKYFRHCLQASRLDPVEFTLFTDDKLARLAKGYMHRQHGSETFAISETRCSSPDDGASQNGYTNAESTISSASNSGSEQKSQDTYVSHFKAVVPGSKNRVTVRIRPPVPPDASTSDLIDSGRCTTTTTLTSPRNGNRAQSPHMSDSPDSNNDALATTTVDTLDLTSLSSLPGFDGIDRLVDLPLPSSEPVLQQLLQTAGASNAHVEEMLSKMRVYTTYTLSRICRGDRTLAFRCPCGRMFVTTRQPESKIRAATLADARRHVMGVHARIANEFLTICCQASRITREYDFQIYPDDMLLRLAMDRPIRLSELTTANAAAQRASLPPLRPLRELATVKQVEYVGDRLPADSHAGEQNSADNSDALSLSSQEGNGSRLLIDASEEDGATIRVGFEDDLTDPKRAATKPMEDPISQLTKAQSSDTEDVERVIDLPYSSEALHSLVEGYCPPDYFPVLEEKMDVYSSLKVFITRRRGRRYFCCSACPSSSPHGMGDIRKHILGVHAKVPERYKAAAMHCSRLSREDNTLLPDHVLLHLAKMKWKGTVIKPLAEMDLTQFGARRASAMGLPRQPGGQFASQVYQPSVQHRDSEKLTALPSTTIHQSRVDDDSAMLLDGTMDETEFGIDEMDTDDVLDEELDNPLLEDDAFDAQPIKPIKIARIEGSSDSMLAVSNGIQRQSILNGGSESTSLIVRPSRLSGGLSGSSRRKPSKLQLVQLKPSEEDAESVVKMPSSNWDT